MAHFTLIQTPSIALVLLDFIHEKQLDLESTYLLAFLIDLVQFVSTVMQSAIKLNKQVCFVCNRLGKHSSLLFGTHDLNCESFCQSVNHSAMCDLSLVAF